MLRTAIKALDSDAPELFAQSERIVAHACYAQGDRKAALSHYERAKRMCRAVENVPAEMDLEAWCGYFGCTAVAELAPPSNDFVAESRMARILLQSIGSVVLNWSRTDFVGRELLTVVENSGCATMAFLEATTADGAKEKLSQIEANPSASIGRSPERLKIGAARGRDFHLIIYSKADSESIATLNAIRLFIDAMQHLAHVKLDEEEHATLWPVENQPTDSNAALISGHMRELMTFAQRVARTNVNVLITGESGTGKEILARAIHDFSDRAQKPFVPVNCAAVPRELLESQLFGHRRGAFTGAERDHTGFIRAARDGTLFLDEIADLSFELQPKLLRFLESGEISPLGDPAPHHVNVRVLAATNTNLEDAVRAGRFREDLFYRLNVVRLSIRPLRERRDEIPGLVNHFITRFAQEFQKGQLTLAEETMERLLLYRWPGNVRQLQNELRRIVALAEPNATLLPEAISDDILRAMPIFRHASNGREIAVSLYDKLPATIARIECEMIKTALQEHRGKVDAAARALGISRKGLYLKRQRLGL